MLNKMHKIKDVVKSLLINQPKLRDNDNKLIANIFMREAGGLDNLKNMSAFEFLKDFADGKYSNFESIRRVRAKLQEDCPELRGLSYNSRKKDGEDTSKGINDL